MEDIKPRLKLIAKRDFELVREKYGFKSEDVQKTVEEKIEQANALDVLALVVVPGSGLKILDVKILNEENEDIFINLLKQGISE